MHSFEMHSNESTCRKKFRLGLEQVLMQLSQFLNIRKSQLIMISKSKYFLMEQCPNVQFLLMVFSTLLIMRQHFLNLQDFLKNTLILKFKKDLSLST